MKRIVLLLFALSCTATSSRQTKPPAPATPHQCIDACLPNGVHLDVQCYETQPGGEQLDRGDLLPAAAGSKSDHASDAETWLDSNGQGRRVRQHFRGPMPRATRGRMARQQPTL